MAACSALVLALGATPATALVYGESFFPANQGQPRCTWVYSSLTRGSGGGDTNSFVSSYSNTSCSNNWGRPAGYMYLNVSLHKLVGGADVLCQGTQTGNYYNTSTGAQWQLMVQYGPTPRCGSGDYRAISSGYVKGNNLDPRWIGGRAGTGPWFPL